MHLKYNPKFTKVPDTPCDKLVCVVTHKRKKFIGKWLRAWNNAEHYNTKLAVIHAFDGIEPPQDEVDNILHYKPDFYVPIYNTPQRDLSALVAVCRDMTPLPKWETLFWFTDDMLPMRRTFLRPFIEKIANPEVGLVAQCYEPKRINGAGGHIRTVAYATKRHITDNFIFPDDGHQFEHGENHILQQVRDMGYKLQLCHSEAESEQYVHWTSFLDWMWDCHLLESWTEYWDVYEEQFNPIQRWENVSTQTETLLSIGQCERYTSIANKICALIATCQAPINTLMWSIFSLLLNSNPNGILEHIIVGINGPDKRTGDLELQDKKQAFLEELRDVKWHNRAMPLTVVRTWSRIGHAQTLEQLIPWVHTEHYLAMHDDVIVLSNKWEKESTQFFNREKVIAQCYGDPVFCSLSVPKHDPKQIRFPHLNSIFTLCKKSLMKEIGANWIGYHIPIQFHIGNFANFQQFMNWHTKRQFVDYESPPREDKEYNSISMDIGSFALHRIANSGYEMTQFSRDIIKHFSAGSWGNGENIVSRAWSEVILLEDKLKSYPEFYKLYSKYKT